MGRTVPFGAQGVRGGAAVDLARSIEPGRATTESANHLRIPDLKNDQAEEAIKVSAAGAPAAVRASNVRNDRIGHSDHGGPRHGKPKRLPRDPGLK
jgi:hypothetical protein